MADPLTAPERSIATAPPGAVAAFRVLGVALVLLVVVPLPAIAHEGDRRLRTVVTDVTIDVPGLVVEVGRSVTDQLLLSNPSDVDVTILTDDGAPFLRIGPDGVLGNLEQPAFHLSNDPFGVARVPPEADGEDPRWGRVSRDPSWGWFDHRLHPVERSVPAGAETGDVLARWTVPIEVDGERGQIRGQVEYRPLRGVYRARADGGPLRVDGVTATVLEGVIPAVLVQNEGTEPVVVLGPDGEPFLRVTSEAVEANLRSPWWHEVSRLEAGRPRPDIEADAAAAPVWEQVADVPRITWLELRTHVSDAEPDDAAVAADVRAWTVPLRIGDRAVEFAGTTRWEPFDAEDRVGLGGGGLVAVVALLVTVAGAGLALRLRRGRGA